jgi:hypothetical protein
MGVRRYQDLVCWQLANELKRGVYALLDESRGASRDFGFCDQLKGAASSGPANRHPAPTPASVSATA